MLKVIGIDELQPGMFVNQVIEQTQGLKIKSKGLVKSTSAIEKLAQQGIVKIQIDLSKSQGLKETVVAPVKVTESQPPAIKVINSETLKQASELYSQAKNVQNQFLKRIRSGHNTDLRPLHDLTLHIIDSTLGNSSAIACISLIKNADEYVLEHSLNCSILMCIFAEHLKFDSNMVEELSFAGLLMDLGMTTLTQDILRNPGSLTPQEWAMVRNHVDIGVELIERFGDVSDLVLDVINNHHERLDGSGYPQGKAAPQISQYARMAAIIDCYDALTSHRPHRKSLSATVALKSLLKDESLDQSLVKEFIRCLGVHPVGSLVKLKSGKLAMVIRANQNNPLKPMVMSFYSITSGHYNEIKSIDLAKVQDEIISSVRPEEFKINLPKFFKDVFIGAIK